MGIPCYRGTKKVHLIFPTMGGSLNRLDNPACSNVREGQEVYIFDWGLLLLANR